MPPKRFQGDQDESVQTRMRLLENRVKSWEDKHDNLVNDVANWASGFEDDKTKISKFRKEFPGQMIKKVEEQIERSLDKLSELLKEATCAQAKASQEIDKMKAHSDVLTIQSQKIAKLLENHPLTPVARVVKGTGERIYALEDHIELLSKRMIDLSHRHGKMLKQLKAKCRKLCNSDVNESAQSTNEEEEADALAQTTLISTEEQWRATRDQHLNKFQVLLQELWDIAAKRPDVKTEHFVAFGQDCQDTDGPHGFDLSLASSTTWWLAPDIASNTGQNILYLPGVFSWR